MVFELATNLATNLDPSFRCLFPTSKKRHKKTRPHAGSDRPKGESSKEYILGFVLTLLAAALYGFVMPMVELTYIKANQTITCALVLEVQMVICCFASAFATVGMIINNDFKVYISIT